MTSIFTCCISTADKEALLRSRYIDKTLAKDKRDFKRTIKILLLGSGESGKSTFLKQMKIIHGEDFTKENMIEYQQTVYMNLVKGMKVLVDAVTKLRISYSEPKNEKLGNLVFTYSGQELDEPAFLGYADAITSLWSDDGIREAFERRSEFQLTDSVQYFFEAVDRIRTPGYLPTKQDILHARKATKGIVEYDIHIQKIPFKFVDVGGQRSQRQKWFQCFDSVTAILFLVSSSEYDQLLSEDRKTNRLVESLNIFETIVKNRSFLDVSIILFLNKTDLLEQKVKKVDISKYFPAFKGDHSNLEHVQQFLLALFDSKCQQSLRTKPLFHHFTTAVNTENIKLVFQFAKDTILQENLSKIMMQ